MKKNSSKVNRNQLLCHHNLIYLALFFITFIGCKTSDVSSDIEIKNELHIDLECYKNAMPMSNGGSYVIITATPTDSIIQENLKIVELTATGDSGTWTAESYDEYKYKGKGLKVYRNIARGFDPSIGSSFDFKLIIEFESGIKKTYELSDITIRAVY